MTTQQLTHLAEQVSRLTHDLAIAQQQLGEVRGYLVCVKHSPETPLQPHGPSKVCAVCYEALRVEFAKASVVVGSIRDVVHARMQKGEPCPFCQKSRKHSDCCYLDVAAGRQILDEYHAIEQHRDMLLNERLRMNAPSVPETDVPRVRLRDRLHGRGPAG